MTSAVTSKDPIAGGMAGGMSRASARRLWQVPLLIAGLVAFGFGVRGLVRVIKPVPFEAHVKNIQGLIAQQQYGVAIEQINKVCNYYKEPRQLGALHMLAGDAYFAVTKEQRWAVPENNQQLVEHYKAGEQFGIAWSAAVRERVGTAELALGEQKEALGDLEKVVAEDPQALEKHGPTLVDGYVAMGARGKAGETLEKYAALKGLGIDERVWALCKRIELTLGTSDVEKAVAGAKGALEGMKERTPAATLLTWIGRAEYEAGKVDEARGHLNDARARFVMHTIDDGRAAILLGKIAQGKREPATALRQYQDAITTHPGSTIFAAARLGRAEVLAGQILANAATIKDAGEVMRTDYEGVIEELQEEGAGKMPALRRRPELVSKEQVKAGLLANYIAYQRDNRLEEALVFLELDKKLGEAPTPVYVFREALTRERRGDELWAQSKVERDGAIAKVKNREAMKLYSAAADAYLRHAEMTTLDDVQHGASLWKAATLLDRAGRQAEAIKAYRRYTIQRPNDPHAPEALWAMGVLYQARGELDEAIKAHEQNRKENPKTSASYLSTVELARCYMAKGEKSYGDARDALLSLVEDNENIDPTANEFRVALFTLAELYHTWAREKDGEASALALELAKGRPEPADKARLEGLQDEALKHRGDAILRLEEAISRYPQDALVARATFSLADCYRKSAGEIGAAIKKDPGLAHRDSLEKARQDRLAKAAELYATVVAMLDKGFEAGGVHAGPAEGTIDEQYLRYSQVSRAECFFELGQYSTAIKAYDAVATRYAQTLTALEAYVQIVRAYLELREPSQAQAAAERARWILKRIPDEAFGKPPLKLTREYYEKFLALGRDVN